MSERAEITRECQKARDREQAMRASGSSAGLGIADCASTMSLQFQMHTISYRVDWETPLGRHKDKSDEHRGGLGPHS